jgi:hypothetical protein
MANTFKNIRYAVTTSLADVYTVPSATTAIVIGCQVANVDGLINAEFDLCVDDSGTDTFLAKTVVIPPDASLAPIAGKLVLETGQKLQAKAGIAGDLELVVSILEIT